MLCSHKSSFFVDICEHVLVNIQSFSTEVSNTVLEFSKIFPLKTRWTPRIFSHGISQTFCGIPEIFAGREVGEPRGEVSQGPLDAQGTAWDFSTGFSCGESQRQNPIGSGETHGGFQLRSMGLSKMVGLEWKIPITFSDSASLRTKKLFWIGFARTFFGGALMKTPQKCARSQPQKKSWNFFCKETHWVSFQFGYVQCNWR